MILVEQDLIELEKQGLVLIKNRNNFGPFSLDLRVKKLFKHKKGINQIKLIKDISDQEYIDKYLEEIPLENKTILTDKNIYFWQPVETMFLAQNYTGKVFTRSSSARKGIYVTSDSSQDLKNLSDKSEFSPLLFLSIAGTEVFLRKEDSIAQLVIYNSQYGIANPVEITKLIETEEFKIKVDGNLMKATEIQENNYINLYFGNKILLYTGGLLDSKESIKENFKEIDISEETIIPRGSFFISSSQESVEIPENYVGMVTQMQTQHSHSYYRRNLPFFSHPNAPVIGPKNIFRGTITFENYAFVDSIIKQGMFLSQLYLERLSSKADSITSKYNNQNGATPTI